MKKELKALLIVNGLFVFIAVCYVFDLITLLYDDSAQYAITIEDIQAASPSSIPALPQLIPKIIHQTYKNETIPQIWVEAQQSCIDVHPDYEYKLWTDASAREFIKDNYEWFLETFDGYPFPIMRADAIRYFVLDHFGGIYIDLDDGCAKPLDPLLQFGAFARKTEPTGISNDVMGAVPGHPFFKKTIANLKRYDQSYLIPYVTIMYSTGPLFLSVLWKQYNRWGVPKADQIKLLVKPYYKGGFNGESFFKAAPGSSWHLGDAKFIFSMGKHWILVTLFGTALVFGFFYLQYLAFGKLLNSKHFKLYNRIIIRSICNRLIRFRSMRRLMNLLGINLTDNNKNNGDSVFNDSGNGLLTDYDHDNYDEYDGYELNGFNDKTARNREITV